MTKKIAKPTGELKELINAIPEKELQKLVLKAALKDKEFSDYLLVNYFDKEFGEKLLFDETISNINQLFNKSYKGSSNE